MTRKEKAHIIDEFLRKFGNSSFGTLSEILDNKPIPSKENENKYRLIESDLIRFELVIVMQEPGTNETISGFGRFKLSPKGIELVNSKKSSLSLYKKERKIISNRTWDVIKIVIGIILGLLLKFLWDKLIS